VKTREFTVGGFTVKLFFFFLFLETGSSYVAWASLEYTVARAVSELAMLLLLFVSADSTDLHHKASPVN
jgi:hypothetical protein